MELEVGAALGDGAVFFVLPEIPEVSDFVTPRGDPFLAELPGGFTQGGRDFLPPWWGATKNSGFVPVCRRGARGGGRPVSVVCSYGAFGQVLAGDRGNSEFLSGGLGPPNQSAKKIPHWSWSQALGDIAAGQTQLDGGKF